MAAVICGGAKLAVSLLTDYPGGAKKVFGFRARREIDLGLAGMVATMPEFLAFKDEHEKKFFLTQGAVISAVSELTRYPGKSQLSEKDGKRAKAA
ncbi:MAG: hypothetical protein JWQ87_87 [Candidatus Sulfotelmatobacter sp.]|nr:hypothetical protein [Candidatus Sulfotelmatobacter sp.]